MTTPSSAPCFFTMDPNAKGSSYQAVFFFFFFAWISYKPKQALICLKAIEWSCFSCVLLFLGERSSPIVVGVLTFVTGS